METANLHHKMSQSHIADSFNTNSPWQKFTFKAVLINGSYISRCEATQHRHVFESLTWACPPVPLKHYSVLQRSQWGQFMVIKTKPRYRIIAQLSSAWDICDSGDLVWNGTRSSGELVNGVDGLDLEGMVKSIKHFMAMDGRRPTTFSTVLFQSIHFPRVLGSTTHDVLWYLSRIFPYRKTNELSLISRACFPL